MNKINIEETVKVKIDKGLPITGPEFGRVVRVLVLAMNELQEQVTKLRSELDEVPVSGSKVDPPIKGNADKTAVRSKQDFRTDRT